MIQIQEITDVQSPLGLKSLDLYLSAFPESERRPVDALKALLAHRNAFHATVLLNDAGAFVGILNYWMLDGFRYVEHFAIDPSLRSQGWGSQALRTFMQHDASPLQQEASSLNQDSSPLVLEVEPPVDALTRSRVAFYERNGLVLSDYEYVQPPYAVGLPSVALCIMSSRALTRTQFDGIVHELHTRVYGVQ